MRFQRVSKAVVVGAAMALALSACAPGGSETSPSASESASGGNAGAEATTTGLADLGDITTKDGAIKGSIGAPEFIS